LNEINLNTKNQELLALLTMIYQSGFDGFDQPQLFSIKKNKEFEEAKKFRKTINELAKKINVKPLELLETLVKDKKRLIKYLEVKNIKHPKFSKIYQHSEMEKIKSEILKPGRLIKTERKTINEDYATGEVEVWKSKDVEYYANVENVIKLKGNPKVSVSQLKNISLLTLLTQEQQFNNETKRTKCEFKLSYYAERRGYTKEEIKRGGIIFEELKRDLFSGAFTAYRINNKETIKGNEYIRHGISSFYDLLEPIKDHSGINWIVEFKGPWKKWIMELLEGGAKQYFIEDRKAVEDRYTTEKPYLFLFYRQLIKRKRANLLTQPVKVINIFKDMKLPEDILDRPRACFDLLKECLIYFADHYQPIPEIEQFFLYNDFHKTKTIKLPLNISEAFKSYAYEDFKGLLAAIQIKDIREAYISFKRPYKKPKKTNELDEQETELLNRTLKWFDGQVTKISLEDQESMIKMYIKKYGTDQYRRLLEREGNKIQANAVEFLTKVLKDPEYKTKEKDDDREDYFRA